MAEQHELRPWLVVFKGAEHPLNSQRLQLHHATELISGKWRATVVGDMMLVHWWSLQKHSSNTPFRSICLQSQIHIKIWTVKNYVFTQRLLDVPKSCLCFCSPLNLIWAQWACHTHQDCTSSDKVWNKSLVEGSHTREGLQLLLSLWKRTAFNGFGLYQLVVS